MVSGASNCGQWPARGRITSRLCGIRACISRPAATGTGTVAAAMHDEGRAAHSVQLETIVRLPGELPTGDEHGAQSRMVRQLCTHSSDHLGIGCAPLAVEQERQNPARQAGEHVGGDRDPGQRLDQAAPTVNRQAHQPAESQTGGADRHDPTQYRPGSLRRPDHNRAAQGVAHRHDPVATPGGQYVGEELVQLRQPGAWPAGIRSAETGQVHRDAGTPAPAQLREHTTPGVGAVAVTVREQHARPISFDAQLPGSESREPCSAFHDEDESLRLPHPDAPRDRRSAMGRRSRSCR